jgi:hypothetical protein
MLEVHATITVRGPVFDGRALVALDDFTEAAVDDVAETGFRDIHFTLTRVLKHPTGYYQSHIRDRALGASHVLYDDRVIYGHWLEGTGSRNTPVTKFEGYFTFRRVAQHLQKKAPAIAKRVLQRYLGRMQ